MKDCKPSTLTYCGAQKRKKRKEENLKSQKMQKISSFFAAPKPVENFPLPNVTTTEVEGCAQTSSEESIEDECGRDMSQIQAITPTSNEPINSTATSQTASTSTSSILESATASEYVTDRANYPVTIADPNVKRFIISQGPCRPPGPFPRDNDKDKRCFSEKYYDRITQTGLKLPVTWLGYSPKLNTVYCEPCWLFGDRKKQGFEPAWAKGINKWKSLTTKIQSHESSNAHVDSCVVYDQWRKKGTIDEETEKQMRREKNFWRQALQRIVNVTLTMAMANLPFRGHRENLGEINNGNFLSIIQLLADYDPVLHELIEMPQRSIKYLSPKIQNEIIQILAGQVQKEIVSDIQQAQFYSIIMDTTQDISKVDQLSQVFRYVSVDRAENGRATSVKIHEVFLGFYAVKDQSAAGIEKDINAGIESKGLKLNKCRGQGYDGAATMSGIYSGVQARIAEKEPNALYVHCAAHNLNLVLQDAMANVKEVAGFFDVTTILEKVNTVSKVLQAKNTDLSEASRLIKNIADSLGQYRNQFEEAKQIAVSLAQQWGISSQFEKKRIPKVKRRFDKWAVDERLNDSEKHFQVTVFFPCLDIVTSQLLNRFMGMDKVLGRFNIIQPAMLSSASDDVLFQAASKLQEIYQEDLSSSFPAQLLNFRSALEEDIQKSSSISDLAHLLLVDNSALSSTLPDVCVALLLFLTLPVTVAAAERSFSKLKLIKNYLRSTMSEQRLSGLAVLSIENERARKLDIDSIVDTFAEVKARRRVF
ncbi:hypothetical protein GDO81_019541 [Engystomops pustulosus]|uniref:Zinc finger MYM-type protein 1 n=1 Tax=Engystomops pustulosus TaxID=76066 RepID=A0AAV6YSB1_ENGPU|nr:hypothetical protein GDO81_019541 [Engystomops pustulosus]